MKNKIIAKGKTLAQVREAIDALDLGSIKYKLVHPDNPTKAWTPEKAERIEKEYKKFLFLNAKYQDKSIVPTVDIDEFWHTHILDTLKYHADCEVVFGMYLHHFPYFGIRGEEDRENLNTSFNDTKNIWEKEYGEQMNSTSVDCVGAECGGQCGSNCSHGKHDITIKAECNTCGAGSCNAGGCDGAACASSVLQQRVRPSWDYKKELENTPVLIA